jgi:hypothetical protein
MASLECTNIECKKMLGYDPKNNVQVIASSMYDGDLVETVKIDTRCPRCKRHNFLIYEE